ncbi:MAG: tRNA (adenosine(37)-N6)-threonylcarbamoyltransferase complex ATPase subunit type 1 TsaE [Clostridiales bacterium]|nr:tRNA (adenosine(37)-N6)-threonylcarbamoyltransferase complex ATPase subunit type 1 TsaE [Clostridiales bacterium]
MNNYEITTNSATETELFAENLAKTFVGGEVLLLHGDLGAGKTHFVKGLAKGLDIDDVITSPTFALHNSYEGRVTLNHFDFYRIDDPEEVAILGLDDFFYDKHAIAAIEWSENIKELLPRKYIDVTIDKLDETTRKITIREIS